MPRRPLLLLLLLPVLLAFAACGDNVPGNAVARVGDSLIDKSTFDHWMRIAAVSSQGAGATGAAQPNVQIPQPPDFAQCVAQKTRTAPKPAKGQPAPTAADFKKQCQQEYEGLRDQVLRLLINEKWVAGEAAEQGVTVSDAELRKTFDQQKKQSFPKPADYQKFLKTSGFTEQDILFRIRLEQLGNKLTKKVTAGKDKVSDAQIAAYYNKNKQRFAQPERRDLRVVLTRTAAKAQQAKRALQSGQPWKTVTKRFSIDQASKASGGILPSVAKGQQEPALDKAVFAAPKGALTGPVKTQFGFYVFKVQKITPASQQPLAQAKDTIRGMLASQNQQKALDAFIKGYQKEWRDKTNCQKGFVIADVCKNGPTTKTTSTAAGAAPPGAAPQGGGSAPPPGQ